MDDQAAMFRPFGEVAVVPDIVETLETGGAEFGAVIVVPKANGQGGKSARADQLALLAAHRPALVIPHIDGEAGAGPLNLAAPDRRYRIAEHETGNDIGATGNRGELHILLDAS
ncbi:hypothetical protein EV132_11592 [Rhizobium sullae]|uniref:Uncharacterized protein n=1 Tax=Rhizobium sullae TaxID=50338 RepID=A0A4R3Q468_RHISU|nr:hypothetical protein EV132_11592 [Rhizobium sullae]